MTAAAAKRIAHLLRGMAQNLSPILVGTARLRVECHELARMLDEHAREDASDFNNQTMEG